LRALLIVAHPLDNAFAKAAAERIRAMLERRGIEVDMIDLYADDFDPRLTSAERRGYFTTPYDSRAVAGYVARLMLAEKLVFVFPQWWFNVPAILKGFFDRVLVPGVAFDHPSGGGPLIPRRIFKLRLAQVLIRAGPRFEPLGSACKFSCAGSEVIAYVRCVWRKAVSLLRLEPPAIEFSLGQPLSLSTCIRRYAGRTHLQRIAEEVLGLSKMSWNNFDLYIKLPATLQSSTEIARIGALLQRFGAASYDYRLFI
jgi:putative NADPH-quinone reductase